VRAQELERELSEAHAELQELRDCVHAAADGEILPAKTYLAGGVLGIQRLDGDHVSVFEVHVAPRQHVQINAAPQQLAVVRRLWVDPQCAPHFTLRSLLVGNQVVIGDPYHDTPCELFARRYGSPLIRVVCEVGIVLSVAVNNMTDETRDFRAVALGYTWQHERK
jgi:hypothetical protein